MSENQRSSAKHNCDGDGGVAGSHERRNEPQKNSGENGDVNSQQDSPTSGCAGEMDGGDKSCADTETDESHPLRDFVDSVRCFWG